MKVGLFLPQIGKQATLENVVKLATHAEREGFDSLWVLERLLWPLKPQTSYQATPDGSLPTDYQRVLDPIDVLSFVAAHTKKILLGTSVIDMLFHTPVILARRFATLDILSRGRIIAGLGLGWSKDEFQVANVPFHRKGARADEFLQALKKVWVDDVVEFDGEFYKIPASKIDPKPAQKPHPQVYLGGFSSKTFERIARYANGWLGVIFGPIKYVEDSMKAMRTEASKIGKDPDQFNVIMLTNPSVSERAAPSDQRFPMTGTIEQIGSDITRLKDIGISHMILAYNFSSIGSDIDAIIETSKELSKYAM